MNYVSFQLNGNPAGTMTVKEDMIFAELASNFCTYYGLKEDNKPTFSFNSNPIKSESAKTLKELGINQMAVIEVKTEKPFNIPPINFNTGNNAANMANNPGNMNNNFGYMGNFPMNNNQFMMMNPGYMNYGMNPGYMNYGMNPGMNPGVNPGYMNPGVNPGMNPGMNPGVNPGMNPGVNPGMNPGMNQAFVNNGYTNYQNNGGQNPNNQNANSGNGGFLDIIFNYKGSPIHVQSTSETKFCDLYQKFCVKADNPQTPPPFYFNNIKIEPNETRTLRELNIGDKATIQTTNVGSQPPVGNGDFINIIFTCHGKIINFQATRDTKIAELAKRFSAKAGNPDQVPTFFMNSRSIDINQDKTLKELNINNQAKIDVVFTAQVIGA
jgi:hypothetical protein